MRVINLILNFDEKLTSAVRTSPDGRQYLNLVALELQEKDKELGADFAIENTLFENEKEAGTERVTVGYAKIINK